MAKSYVLPFVAYLVGVSVASQWSGVYPLAYAAVVVLVGALMWFLLRGHRIVVPHRRISLAVALGLIGITLWIGLSGLGLEARVASQLPEWLRPSPRVAYNPFEELTQPLAIWGFIGLRLIGLVVIVPVAEELFWRGFLLRWLTSPDWEQVPLGRFSGSASLLVVILFTLAHPEWLAAAVYCALLNWLLYWKKDLWSCIVAHGVSNLALAIYILATGAWQLW